VQQDAETKEKETKIGTMNVVEEKKRQWYIGLDVIVITDTHFRTILADSPSLHHP